ncbi:uncharacterized protein V2V93DRAFT_370700 [Kockiozyma suomiensis]|uniref:uncharacterized protein n=1 Tax=Kockiozyma suomiensis TaxID=1337062 RepID=UPI003343C043
MSTRSVSPPKIAADEFSLESQLQSLHEHPEPRYADVLFLMPSNSGAQQVTIPLPTRVWAHSALLAVIYLKPLSRLGTAYLSSYQAAIGQDQLPPKTSCGLEYTIVEVAPENDLTVRKLVASCYRPVVLRSLWERKGGKREMLAALDEGVLLSCKETALRTLAVAADSSSDAESSPIPISEIERSEFSALATPPERHTEFPPSSPIAPSSPSSGFAADPQSYVGDIILKLKGGNVSFTIHKFILDLRAPYFCTLFRSAFADASLTEHTLSAEYFTPLSLAVVAQYLYLDDAEILFAWKWTDFSRYIASKKCTSDINAPNQEIFDAFADALVAAKFLQLESLEAWIIQCLVKIGHGFACTGTQCTRLLPGIVNLGHQYQIGELYNPCMSWMSRHTNVSVLWKRSLLALPDEVLADLVREVNAKISPKTVIPLYLRLYGLRLNTTTSIFRDEWEDKLLTPLMNDCTGYIAAYFAHPRIVFSVARALSSTSYNAMENLLILVVTRKICAENATAIWRGVECLAKLITSSPIVEMLNINVATWFVEHWRELVPKSYNSTRPKLKVDEAPKEDEVLDFGQWPEDSVQKLSAQINVPAADLRALPPAARNFEYRKERWLERCRVEEANRLMRRHELMRAREGERRSSAPGGSGIVDYGR